jgi:MinD-like ATPase involved in chromosome partitioning or flagellar assembly
MPAEDDFFADADAPEAPESHEHDVDRNGAGPPAARTAPPARGAVSSLREALTGAAEPREPRVRRADRLPAAADRVEPEADDNSYEAVARSALPPRPIGRGDVYRHPVGAGREQRDTLLRRLLDHVRDLLTSPGEREEQLLGQRIGTLPAVSRTNVIAVLSPKGGVGKTTSTYLVGDALADLGRVDVVAVDANPDYGTLGSLAPDAIRSDRTLADLLEAFEQRPTFAELRPYLSQVRSGLKLLGAPGDPEVMQRLTPDDYDKLLELLAQHVEVVLLDCGTGLAGPLARWAIQRADQVVIVTTPDWVTSNNVAGALSQVRHAGQATLVLNQARLRGPGDQRAIEDHFRRQAIEQRVTIPYDEQLRTMLDSGTYDLAQLRRPTRLAIKSLAVTVGEGLR